MKPVDPDSGQRPDDPNPGRDPLRRASSRTPRAPERVDRVREQEKARVYAGWCLLATFVLVVAAMLGSIISRWWRG